MKIKDPKAKARHALYWATVGLTFPLIPFVVAGAWLNEQLTRLFGKYHAWAYQEKYRPKPRIPAPELSPDWGPEE